MCNCSKGVNRNKKLVSRSNTANYAFNDNSFELFEYKGESEVVIGEHTKLNYGERETGDKFLIHNKDYNPDEFNEIQI